MGEEEKGKRVKFSDLSLPIKIAVVAGWLFLAIGTFYFIVGFIGGFFSSLT